ncbi:hypothetical protein [Acidovorax sacchari]|uniref:hypothetical protein n=1 Tax=Acidovorax sacchari TaxID=3230736 RepID=UPI0039E602C4
MIYLIIDMAPINLNPFSRKKNHRNPSHGESSSQAAERGSRHAPHSPASDHLSARQGAASHATPEYSSGPRLDRRQPFVRDERVERLATRATQYATSPEGSSIGRGGPYIDHRINPPDEETWQNLFDADSAAALGLEEPEWAQASQAWEPWYGEATPVREGQAAMTRIDLRDYPHASVDSLPEPVLQSLGTALGLPGSTGYLPAPALAEGIRQSLAALDMGVFSVYDDVHILNMDRDTPLRRNLDSSDRHRLSHLATKTHMTIRQTPVTPAVPGGPSYRVSIYFDGMPDGSKQQNGTTLKGGVGRVYRMACEAAQLVAKALQADPTVQVSHICGLSMGGGSAQMFAAVLQGHLPWSPPPAVVLLDPMLLNPKQKAHAMAQSPHGYDFTQPRGIALTLDYAANPRKCLMDRQHAIGRSSEGLVRLRLGLTDRDGLGGTPPKPHGPPGTGYHSNRHHYEAALARFTG